jgi:hypothetical protein
MMFRGIADSVDEYFTLKYMIACLGRTLCGEDMARRLYSLRYESKARLLLDKQDLYHILAPYSYNVTFEQFMLRLEAEPNTKNKIKTPKLPHTKMYSTFEQNVV